MYFINQELNAFISAACWTPRAWTRGEILVVLIYSHCNTPIDLGGSKFSLPKATGALKHFLAYREKQK